MKYIAETWQFSLKKELHTTNITTIDTIKSILPTIIIVIGRLV